MTKSIYTYLVAAGVVIATVPALASGVPVYGAGEVVNMSVDQYKGQDVRDLVKIQKEMASTFLDALGGPETFSSGQFKSEAKKALTDESKAISTYDGLLNLLGSKSEYGEIKVKKCGGNADDVIQRLNETVALPAKQEDRLKLSTSKKEKIADERAKSLERAATSGLAKAWTAQAETASVAESIDKTQEELDNANSQMAVLATIARLQEEAQKNLNKRLSLMADDMTVTGLTALGENI